MRWCWWVCLILQLWCLLGAWLPHADSRAGLCAGQHCAQCVCSAGLFCSLLAKSWNPNQGRFSPHLGWISELVLEGLWSTQSLMLVVQEMKGGDECALSSSATIYGFQFSCIFTHKLHGNQFLLEAFEVLRGYVLKSHSYCSAAAN